MKQAKEVLDIVSLGEEERIAYEWHIEEMRYQANMYHSSFVDGRMEGKKEGLEKGIEKGREEGRYRNGKDHETGGRTQGKDRAIYAVDAGRNRRFMNTRSLPLAKGQEGLYHLHRMAPESPAYNIGFSFVIHSKLDIPAMRDALQALIRRHAVLRTSFAMGETAVNRPDISTNIQWSISNRWTLPHGMKRRLKGG